jgi:hypothetical protein
VPESGTPLTVDGKEAGFVTRAAKVWDAVPPRILGMGYVRREAGARGNALQWAGETVMVAK